MKTFRDRLIEKYLAEARFPWEKFPEPPKGPSIGGNPDPMGSKKRDVSNIGPSDRKDKLLKTLEYDEFSRDYPEAYEAWIDRLGEDSEIERYLFVVKGKLIQAHRKEDLSKGDNEPEFYFDPSYGDWSPEKD